MPILKEIQISFTITIWYANAFPLSKILRNLLFLPVLGSFTTMSEISKSLRGKGIFLLAAIVFSSPGRRVVRATCRTNRDAASQIPSKYLIFFFLVLSIHNKNLKVIKCKYCTYLLCKSNFDLEFWNVEMYILSVFYILHFLKEFICELKNWYHFTGGSVAVQHRKKYRKWKKFPYSHL